MPAFLSKDSEIQREISRVLPAIACMSLGPYNVVLNHIKDRTGHSLFSNTFLNITLLCPKCHNTTERNSEQSDKELNKDDMELCSERNSVTLANETTMKGLINLFAKFLNMKQYTDVENSEYWSLLERLSHHFYVFNYGVSKEIITEPNCQHILKAFRPYIHNTVSS